VASRLSVAMKRATTCPICSKLRGLSEHLIELSEAASLLGNTSKFTSEHGIVTIRTETIGNWLSLAAQLEEVRVNTAKYADDSQFYCETIADAINTHSEHYTNQATNLTRFLFVCNALEESYRLIDHEYGALVSRSAMSKSAQKRSSSLRATQLIEDLLRRKLAAVMPLDFDHISQNFISLFESYVTNHPAELSGVESDASTKKSYSLHLIRNLRNHAAHGMFPLGPPEDFGGDPDFEKLQQLLQYACRVAGLYIQMIFRGFSPGFESYDYRALENANGIEFDKFLAGCSIDYIKNLHVQGPFAFHKGLYQAYP
jgi:hypothetical protein